MRRMLYSLVASTVTVGLLTACNDSTTPAASLDTPSRAIAISGTQQRVTVGQRAADSLGVVVYGVSGELLAGTTVQWAIVDGRGTLSTLSTVTNAAGVAQIAFNADTVPGVSHVSATVGATAAVSYEETVIADAPARLIALMAPEDSVFTGAIFSGALVEVVDRYGNAVPGVTLTVSEQGVADGDVLTNTVVSTDASGLATDAFIAGVVGQRLITIATDGGLTVTYRIDVEAGNSGT